MGGPATDERGVADRGTAHRISTPRPGARSEYPAFHVDVLGLLGPSAIPAALAYALEWQLEFNALAARPAERKEVADKLIKIWHYLKEMEERSPRDADGALLLEDPLQVLSRAKVQTELVELASGETVLVTRNREEAPLPVWQPALFPPDLPLDVQARYPARPTRVEEIPPFRDAIIRQWILTSLLAPDSEAAPAPSAPSREPGAGPDEAVPEAFVLDEVEDTFRPGEDEAEKAIADAAKKVDREKWTAARLAAFRGYTPTVNAAIARLATTTLGDIQRHTGEKFRPEYLDDPLLEATELILYHSVFSFALDRNGEPFDLRHSSDGQGLVDYPILLDEPGETVRRDVPPDDGVYVSVQKYGFGLYKLADTGIEKVLFGTVGAFTAYGYGASAPSGVHRALQTYIDRFSPQGYVAAVTVPGAYKREEITLGRIRERIPEFVDVVTPYLVKEVVKRAESKLDNWQDFAAEVAIDAIRQLILDKVKGKVRDYLVKKIGKRIIPGVNAVSALYDLVAGGEEGMRIRNVIACTYVALKSDSAEDAHIAGKTCAKVLADEFEDAVVDALIARSKSAAKKLKRKTKEQRDSDERARKAQPNKEPESPKSPDPAPSPTTTGDGGKGAARPQGEATAGPNTSTGTRARPTDVPARKDAAKGGAQTVQMSDKSADQPSVEVKSPRPPNKRERQAQERWAEKQRQHDEKIRKKIEDLKKQEEERKKLAANGDPAGTGDDGKQDKGTAKKGRGTEDKGTGATEGTAGTANTGAKPANTGADPAKTGAGAGNTGTRPGQVQQKPPPPKRPPPDPNEPRGTLEKPRPVDPGPRPKPEPVHVKKPDAPEGTDDVRDQANVRTGRASHEQILRRNAEKESGAFPIDHDAHHNALKAGGKEAGEASRDALSQSGVSVDHAANATAARGLPRDPRAPLESSSQHWGLHKPGQIEALRRELETVKGDPAATRDVLKKHGLEILEGRTTEPPDFWLGPDPDPPPPKKPKGPKKK